MFVRSPEIIQLTVSHREYPYRMFTDRSLILVNRLFLGAWAWRGSFRFVPVDPTSRLAFFLGLLYQTAYPALQHLITSAASLRLFFLGWNLASLGRRTHTDNRVFYCNGYVCSSRGLCEECDVKLRLVYMLCCALSCVIFFYTVLSINSSFSETERE